MQSYYYYDENGKNNLNCFRTLFVDYKVSTNSKFDKIKKRKDGTDQISSQKPCNRWPKNWNERYFGDRIFVTSL